MDQMELGEFHAFPEHVTAFQDAGQVTKRTGHDGIVRDMLKTPGEYRGRTGVFEFVKEADGQISHLMFKPNQPCLFGIHGDY
jgi:filamentous hemagglutinin